MARKSKLDAEKTRARILASALSLFSKKGYDHTTFTDIASRLKLTKGAVYWHFASKETLLSELVRLALEKFQRQMKEIMPSGELTYPAVAEAMVRNASLVVSDPKAAAFFRLMKCQVRWSDASMATVRNDLMNNLTFGPKQAFVKAVENDRAAGRVRPVNADEIATVSLAVWDGVVHARINHFLTCDMVSTLRHAFESIWKRIQI